MELTNQDIQDFYGCSPVTARARVREVKKYLKLKRKGRLLAIHVAKYEGLTLNEFKIVLELMQA